MRTALFRAITKPVVIIPYRRLRTILTLEEVTVRLSRNVCKKSPLLAAIIALKSAVLFLTKIGICRQSFVKVYNKNFNENSV